MNVTRREIRVEVMNALYQYDLYLSERLSFTPYFEIEDAENIYDELIERLDFLDEIIEEHLYEYSLRRLAFLDRAIIRLAVFEMVATDLPIQIIIDEAIEITKMYSDLDDGKQHRFTNKVLDNIAKTRRG